MKNLTKTGAVLVLGLIFTADFSLSQEPFPSLFSDRRAWRVGDILTVLIVETSAAKSEANSATSKESDHGVNLNGGKRSQSFMPLYGLRGQMSNGFDNDAATSRSGSLRGKITATIAEINENGNFKINGIREMSVNGEMESILISGVVRPEDISTENTVYSFQIADAKISYKGKGLVDRGQKPGLIDKILGWLF